MKHTYARIEVLDERRIPFKWMGDSDTYNYRIAPYTYMDDILMIIDMIETEIDNLMEIYETY